MPRREATSSRGTNQSSSYYSVSSQCEAVPSSAPGDVMGCGGVRLSAWRSFSGTIHCQLRHILCPSTSVSTESVACNRRLRPRILIGIQVSRLTLQYPGARLSGIARPDSSLSLPALPRGQVRTVLCVLFPSYIYLSTPCVHSISSSSASTSS